MKFLAMVIYKRASKEGELQQILDLQQRNLFSNVSQEEQRHEGFVTVTHTLDLLKRMNDKCAHIIATDREKVVGYALCMHPQFSNEIKILNPMFQAIADLDSPIKKFLAMGQVCVDKEYRKKGIFRGLYQTMKNAVKPEFEMIITEVHAKNQRSLQAHYSVGFELLKTHISNDQEWKMIGLCAF